MPISNSRLILATTAALATAGLTIAPTASAESTTQPFGSQGKLTNGDVVQGWTISDLKPSSDTISHQPVGTLWEATATDQAIEGSATPIVSNLNARASNGDTYRVLFQVPTSQGVNPATLGEGDKTSGKVYFDVTGPSPDSVVYIAGGEDLLTWVGAPAGASEAASPSPRTYQGTPSPARAPAATAATPAATAGTPAAAAGTPLPAGSAGTPLPAGSTGTPATAGTPAAAAGTPLPAGSAGTPLPAGSAGTPLPAGSAGTPVPASAPAGSAGTPAAPAALAPAPAGSQGTPAEGAPTPAGETPPTVVLIPGQQPATTTG